VLYLRPRLCERPNLVVLAVASMIPLINCGEVISDEHCLRYGATLLGMMEEEYYREICALADWAGSEVCFADDNAVPVGISSDPSSGHCALTATGALLR
jgi:hypothetical protein